MLVPSFETAAFALSSITLFTALWTLVNRREGRSSDSLLAFVQVLFAANTLHPLAMPGPISGNSQPFEPLQFVLLLSLLWYGRSLTQKRWWGYELLVLTIPVGMIAWGANDQKIFFVVFWVCLTLTAAALLFPLGWSLHRNQMRLKEEYSNLDGVDTSWLSGFLRVLWVLFALYSVALFLLLHAPQTLPLRLALSVVMGVLGVYLGWKSIARKVRVPGNLEPTAALETPSAEIERNAVLVRRTVEEKKLYLEAELTLEDLAAAAGLSRHDASAALNQGLDSTFYDFINRYRIAEFQRLARDEKRRGEKILTLAFEAGFNSKPTFNLVFKKITGTTPSSFRTFESDSIG